MPTVGGIWTTEFPTKFETFVNVLTHFTFPRWQALMSALRPSLFGFDGPDGLNSQNSFGGRPD